MGIRLTASGGWAGLARPRDRREHARRARRRVPRCRLPLTGDSLTYANVAEQNRALATHSLRPWATRIERAISSDADLCPGGTYVQFDFDGLLRAASEQRAQQYTAALSPETGWMTRAEVRELEDLPPESEDGASVVAGRHPPLLGAAVDVQRQRRDPVREHAHAGIGV